MKKQKILAVILALAMVLLAFPAMAAEEIVNTTPTEHAFVMTENGGVMGLKYEGVERYLGIPYATAERFQMPQEISWEGYMTCFNFGPASPQALCTTTASVNMFNLAETAGEMVGNENCQNLNIWTKDSKTEELKPVIFWIHGGGFTEGSSHQIIHYEGCNLAAYGDVVFVSVNHRLDAFGYLDLSAYGEKYKYSGNAGMADLVAALEWVHRNISAFGGDPDNVTIVGQSGGGSKVTTLMGLPAAKGLFAKAMPMSGGSVQTTRTTEQSQAETAKVVEILGLTADTISEIETMPYEQIAAAAAQAGVSYGPTVDGDYYPDGTFEMSKDIPIMTGNVMGELFASNTMGIWYSSIDATPFPNPEVVYNAMLSNQTEESIDALYKEKYGDMADEIKAEFAAVYPTHSIAEGVYVNDRSSGNQAIARKMAEYGGTAYNYLDVYVYPMFGGIVGTHTTTDIPFFFHNLDKMGMYIAGDEVNAYHLQDVMATALVNFAYTGDPSQEGIEWAPLTLENNECMVFDVVSECRANHDTHLFELIKAASDSGSAPAPAEAAEEAPAE